MIYFSRFTDNKQDEVYVIVSTDDKYNARYIFVDMEDQNKLVFRTTNEILNYTELELSFDEPLNIKTESDGLFAPIKSRSCTINYVTDKNLFDLYQLSPQLPSVKVYSKAMGEEHPLFWGYATPASYNQAYNMVNELSVTCCDALSTLKYYRYKDMSLGSYPSIKSFIDKALARTNMYSNYYLPRTINIETNEPTDIYVSDNKIENGQFVGEDYLLIRRNLQYLVPITTSTTTSVKYTIVFGLNGRETRTPLFGERFNGLAQENIDSFNISHTNQHQLAVTIKNSEYRFPLNGNINKHVLEISFLGQRLDEIKIDGTSHQFGQVLRLPSFFAIGNILDFYTQDKYTKYEPTESGDFSKIYYFESLIGSTSLKYLPSVNYDRKTLAYKIGDFYTYLALDKAHLNGGYFDHIPNGYTELDFDKLLVNQDVFIEDEATYYDVLEAIATSFCLSVVPYDNGIYFIDYQGLLKQTSPLNNRSEFWHYTIDGTKEAETERKVCYIEGLKHGRPKDESIRYASSDITLSIDDTFNKIIVTDKLKPFVLIDQNDIFAEYEDITEDKVEGQDYAEKVTNYQNEDDENTTTTMWYKFANVFNKKGDLLTYYRALDGTITPKNRGDYHPFFYLTPPIGDNPYYANLDNKFLNNQKQPYAYDYSIPLKAMAWDYTTVSELKSYKFDNLFLLSYFYFNANTSPLPNSIGYSFKPQFVSDNTVFNGGFVAIDFEYLYSKTCELRTTRRKDVDNDTFDTCLFYMWIESENGRLFRTNFGWKTEEEIRADLKRQYPAWDYSVNTLWYQQRYLALQANDFKLRNYNEWIRTSDKVDFPVDDAPSGHYFELPKTYGRLCVQVIGNPFAHLTTDTDIVNEFCYIKNFKATVFMPLSENITNIDNLEKDVEYSNVTDEDYIVQEDTTELRITSQPNNKYYSKSSIIYNDGTTYNFIPYLQSRLYPSKVYGVRLEEYVINKKLSHHGKATVILEGDFLDMDRTEPIAPYTVMYESNLNKWFVVDSKEYNPRTRVAKVKMYEYGNVLKVSEYEVKDIKDER